MFDSRIYRRAGEGERKAIITISHVSFMMQWLKKISVIVILSTASLLTTV